ncbi:polymer-forming cytoskeletal protein [Streptococcus sp. ZJ151]|uniref:polymer-forming cytoskeletal protein n=1 Tax=Streptococcus jiangjianxini TaxID=3161189 RepID=UPI0032EB9783
MTKKYELLAEDTIKVLGRKLFRIKAIISFGIVDEGDLGGYVEKGANLSQYGNAWVYGDARVYGDAKIFGDAKVFGDTEVFGNARVYGDAEVFGDARVYGDAEVFGDARIYGNAEVFGDARVKSSKDYIVFKNTWSSFRWFTYTKSNQMWRVGCFYGTGQELIKKAYKDSELSGKCYEAYVNLVSELEKIEN